jgi:hypothetical protein
LTEKVGVDNNNSSRKEIKLFKNFFKKSLMFSTKLLDENKHVP